MGEKWASWRKRNYERICMLDLYISPWNYYLGSCRSRIKKSVLFLYGLFTRTEHGCSAVCLLHASTKKAIHALCGNTCLERDLCVSAWTPINRHISASFHVCRRRCLHLWVSTWKKLLVSTASIEGTFMCFLIGSTKRSTYVSATCLAISGWEEGSLRGGRLFAAVWTKHLWLLNMGTGDDWAVTSLIWLLPTRCPNIPFCFFREMLLGVLMGPMQSFYFSTSIIARCCWTATWARDNDVFVGPQAKLSFSVYCLQLSDEYLNIFTITVSVLKLDRHAFFHFAIVDIPSASHSCKKQTRLFFQTSRIVCAKTKCSLFFLLYTSLFFMG